jgi:hypothetical protein
MLNMTTKFCSVCHFKNVCNKSTDDAAMCNHGHIVKKMLHYMSINLDETDDQQPEYEEINILDELLAK